MDDIKMIKEVAQEAAKEAGRYLLERLGNIKEISRKGGINDLVTDVDKRSEQIIITKIKSEFPSHSILAEESGEENNDSTFKWIIDPLDGTTNYTHSFPFFCVSIGVSLGSSMKLGVVYDPSRNEFFTAEENKGAFLNGNRIDVSKWGSVGDSLIATGFAYDISGKIANIDHFKKILQYAQAVRRAGSAALDLCYVACGRFDGFWEIGLQPWDMAAGYLIVKEAGGLVSLLNGGPFDIYQNDIVATNRIIHDELIELLKGSQTQ